MNVVAVAVCGVAASVVVAFLLGWFRPDTWVAPDEPTPTIRHTIDHRCNPPWSTWSTFDDTVCYADLTTENGLLPGDVWTCPECLVTRIVKNGKWVIVP